MRAGSSSNSYPSTRASWRCPAGRIEFFSSAGCQPPAERALEPAPEDGRHRLVSDQGDEEVRVRPLRGLPPEVRALTGVAFMVALGFGLVAPALPLFAREFGVGKAAAGAVVSAFALMRLAMAPFVGRLVNAFGERVMLATGIGVVAVSSALAGFAHSYWQLLVLRGIGGIGSIMFSVSAASILVRVTPDHQRGRAQGVWAGAFLVGMIAGPAVGTVATFSLRAPFFLYAGTLVIAGLLGLGALRHSELASPQATRTAPLPLATAMRNRAYLAALAAAFAGDFALVGARSSLLPQYVMDDLHLPA